MLNKKSGSELTRYFQFLLLYSIIIDEFKYKRHLVDLSILIIVFTRKMLQLCVLIPFNSFNSYYCILESRESAILNMLKAFNSYYCIQSFAFYVRSTRYYAFNSYYCIHMFAPKCPRCRDLTFNSYYCILNVNFYLSFLILYSIFT